MLAMMGRFSLRISNHAYFMNSTFDMGAHMQSPGRRRS